MRLEAIAATTDPLFSHYPSPFGRYLRLGVLGSLVFHILLAVMFSLPRELPPRAPLLIDVALSPAQNQVKPKQTRQIVTPPDAGQVHPKAPEHTLLESDKNVQVPREQIKRGVSDAGPAPLSPKSAPAVPAKASKPERKLLTKLNRDTLLDQFGASARTDTPSSNASPNTPVAARPFSRPLGSGARILGMTGTADHLPSLPDGDITLLNTKANVFAVFVRRVASSVFAQMRTAGWDALRAADIKAIEGFATVRASMSLTGELLGVETLESSGNTRFDQVLTAAVRRGARDRNPPARAALDNGRIQFIFKARSWVRYTGNQHGGLSERRWLLLGTGLE